MIEETNWNQVWESNFEPVIVDDFVLSVLIFMNRYKDVQHEIIITPKMSFGTGHHATTYMMMQQMREIDFTGKTVFDFGTGTGVLAILAEKLGAKNVWRLIMMNGVLKMPLKILNEIIALRSILKLQTTADMQWTV